MDKYIELGSNENKIVFCGGYDTPTLLQNLQKRYLMWRGVEFSKHVTNYGQQSRAMYYNMVW